MQVATPLLKALRAHLYQRQISLDHELPPPPDHSPILGVAVTGAGEGKISDLPNINFHTETNLKMIIRDTELNIRQNHSFSIEDFGIVLPIKILELVKSKKK